MVPLASSMASSSVAKGWTVTTGPKISSHTTSSAWNTPSITVGSKWKPAPVRLPPARTLALAGSRDIKPSTRSSCAALFSGPRSAASPPTCSAAAAAARAAPNSAWMDSSHQHPGHGGAVLPGVEERAERDLPGRQVNVDVGEDDRRCLAAEFQVDVLEGLRRRGHHLRPGPGGAGDGHHFRDLVIHHGGTGPAAAADDVHDAGRVGLLRQLAQDQRWTRAWCPPASGPGCCRRRAPGRSSRWPS